MSTLVNEKFELIKLFNNQITLFSAISGEFKDIWYNDLTKVFQEGPMNKLEISANSILKYFGINKTVKYHSYDVDNQSIIWEIK